MDLGPTDDRQALRAAYATFFRRQCPTSLTRDTEALGFATLLWRAFARTGGPEMVAPAALGGGGATLSEAVVVAEEAGRAIAPLPLAEHFAAVRVLARAGADASVPERVWRAREPATLALWPMSSGSAQIPAGAVAGSIVVLDRRDGRLLLLGSDPPNEAAANLAGLPVQERDLDLDGPGATLVATGERAARAYAAAVDDWRILIAAMLVGLAEAALADVVAYVKERRQFGVPIGTFQALQHGLAEFPGRIAGARLLATKASWAIDQATPEAHRLAGMALLFAAEVAQSTTSTAVHYQGGHGVMVESDAQLYYRRAKGWPLQLADPAREYRRLADAMYGGRTGEL
jgi:alkylation response protein AidB-like acyl-CoA dehydrogenase